MPDMKSNRLTISSLLLTVFIMILWGTNPVALKISLRGFPPIGAAGLRFLIAATGVLLWCMIVGIRVKPRRAELPWLFAVGGFFTAQIATFTLGVHWGTASHSVVLLHAYPFFVVALAHFFVPGDRATPWRVAGIAVAFAGILALFVGGWGRWQGSELLGDSVQFLSAFILGMQIVFTKHAVSRIAPSRIVLWQMVLGTVAFMLYSLFLEDLTAARPDCTSVLAIIYQGVAIGTVAFTIWTWLIRHHAASRIAVFGFISPLVGVFLSAMLLGEPITATLLASAALVGVGIILANLR